MKNVLHFSKAFEVDAVTVNRPKDSGNGYYSYSYYILPYSGVMTPEKMRDVYKILHDRHYRPPFTSLGGVQVYRNVTPTGGELLVSLTYHHGD